MPRNLNGCRVLLTGATSDVGQRLAEKLASQGARLVVHGRSPELLQELGERLGDNVEAMAGDLTRDEDRRELLRSVGECLGGLDFLINPLEGSHQGWFAGSCEANAREEMEVNFFAAAELMRLAIPLLRDGRESAVVNVVSVAGRRGLPGWSDHSASQFALYGLSEALRGEMVRYGIDVRIVQPGMRRDGTHAAATADRVLDALQGGRAITPVGCGSKWLVRLNRFFPRMLDRIMTRRVRRQAVPS